MMRVCNSEAKLRNCCVHFQTMHTETCGTQGKASSFEEISNLFLEVSQMLISINFGYQDACLERVGGIIWQTEEVLLDIICHEELFEKEVLPSRQSF